MFKPITIAAVLALSTLSLKTLANDESVEAGSLVIENTFTFATPPGALAAGGYLTITNNGPEDDTLTGGAADFAELTQVHEMKMVEGVMKMRHLDLGLTIPAGESVTLQPGGYHMMFMQLTQPLKEGEPQSGSLTFTNAGEVSVKYAVIDRSKHMSGHQQHGKKKPHNMKHDDGSTKKMDSDN